MHEGEEAEMASRASLSGVVRKIEQENSQEYSDEELREMEAVDNEVNFQVELLELLQDAKREPSLVKKCFELGVNQGISNIGVSLED